MAKDLAMVLNDGSINAAVATALATQKYRPIFVGTINPADDSSGRRKAAYDAQVAHFKPFREHTFITPGPVVDASANDPIDPRQTPPLTPVLRRQTPAVAVAIGYALHYEASALYLPLRVGGQGDDLARATEFVQIWNEMLQLTLDAPETALVAPILELDAWQVVDLGFQVGAPLERTWCCTADTIEPCGTCRGCREREAAFMRAAKPDPARAIKKA